MPDMVVVPMDQHRWSITCRPELVLRGHGMNLVIPLGFWEMFLSSSVPQFLVWGAAHLRASP